MIRQFLHNHPVEGRLSGLNLLCFLVSGLTNDCPPSSLTNIRNYCSPADRIIKNDTPSSNKYPVFVLDDNKQVCDSLRALIESLNIECETFSTEAALTERISNSKCGLLVIDVQLQDSNGTEVLQRLRKTGCSTHAILMSGHSVRSG